MLPSFARKVEEFVGHRFRELDRSRAAHMAELELNFLLSDSNPYLDRVVWRESASQIIDSLIDGESSSLDERLFDDFLSSLAVFVSEEKCEGEKSGINGIDIELQRGDTRYLIVVRPRNLPDNSFQYEGLAEDFQRAVKVLKKSKTVGEIQPTIGICYGRTKRRNNGAFLQVSGQDFWELISGEPDLYMDIIEPIGYRAREFNDEFIMKRDHTLNRMVREFTEKFCTADGKIDWQKIVTHVSKTS